MQKLVILLHAQDLTHPSWVVLDAAGQVLQTVLHGDPVTLSAEAKNRTAIVIVPAEDVLLTSVTLPKMSRARLLQAIPYALEEQIIEDVETMQFAAGEYHANEKLAVAVTSRAKMSEWTALLKSFAITPDVMIPAIFALPCSEGIWHACVNDVAAVRTGVASGFACDKINLAEMLSLAIANADLLPQEIAFTNIHGTLQLSLQVAVQEKIITSEQLMESMAQQAAVMPPLNMLQGDFQQKKARGMPKMTNLIRTAAYLGVAWLALMFLYPVISFAILDQRARDIKSQIAVIYKKQFPNSSSIVAPKERMQQKLNKLSSGISDNHLLTMMANIGTGLSQASGVILKRMDFQNNVMTLEISAGSSGVFSDFTDALTRQGLQVKQQNANLSGAHVSATLEIE